LMRKLKNNFYIDGMRIEIRTTAFLHTKPY
jgi:hypothetical protein